VPEPLEPQPGIQPGTPLLQPEPAGAFHANPEEELRAKIRLGWANQTLQRTLIQPPPDPGYRPWQDMKGYEPYASTLSRSRSKSETDALKRLIDRNKQDQQTAASGELGLLGDLIAGTFDPSNLVPMPWVKGIGLVRSALYTSAAFGALAAGTEVARINADPTAQWSEMPGNIALASLLGGIVGAPVGMWGARAARSERAIRAFEADLGNVDSPFHSLRPRSQPGLRFESARPPRAADGTYPLFAQVEETIGYEPKTVDGVTYVSEDGLNWTTAAEEGRAGPLAVSDDIAEHLGQPTPIRELVQKGDEVRVRQEFNKGQWHDELQSYIDGGANVRHVVRDANDYYNFRHYQHIYERSLPKLAGETPEAWRQRVGQEAMREYRGSQQGGDYAGFLAQMLGRMNFSPVVKAIRLARGDNRVAELSLNIGGDYKWAIEGNQTRWSTPPSLILNSMRQHTPRYHRFLNEFEAEWVKYAGGDQNYGGRTFQGLNVSAAAYKLKRGLRRGGGAQGMTHADFEEMVAEAVFNPNDFEVRGFPVNENARAAAKAFTRMAQEYDDLLRASGAFKDQKNLARDLKHWNRQIVYHQNRVMEWLWGREGRPANLQHAIRVREPGLLEGGTERIFTGTSHDEAIQNMIDELGDDGIALSEQLTANDYGYTYREAPAAKAAPAPIPDDFPDEVLPPRQFVLQTERDIRDGGMTAAVKYGDEIISAGEHTQAVEQMILRHPEFEALFEANPEAYLGWAGEQQMGLPPGPAPVPGPPAPASLEAGVRAAAEQEAEWNRLAKLVNDGTATPEEIAAHAALTKTVISNIAKEMGLFQPKPMAASVMDIDPFSFDPQIAGFKSLGEVLSYIRDNTGEFGTAYNELIGRIFEDVKDIPLHVVDEATMDAAIAIGAEDGMLARGALGTFDPVENVTRIRGQIGDMSGANPVVITHEAVHAATNRRIEQGILDKRLGRTTPYSAMLDELEGLRDEFFTLAERDRERLVAGMDLAGRQEVDFRLKLAKDDIHEFLTYATTQPQFKAFLQATPARRPRGAIQTLWDEIVDLYLRLTGKEVPTRADQLQIEQLFDVISRYTEMQQPLLTGELAPGVKAMEGPAPQFVNVADAMDQRVRAMSPEQKRIFDERAGALLEAQEYLAKTQADLKTVTETPHQFLDANGKPEPWFHRVWDKSKGATEREQLTRLFTKWFERDNPDGARQRAELAIDNILNDSTEIAGTATLGMSPLRQRTLNIPNSWSIEDPEFGTIKVSDFIDKRVTAIAEHYSKRAGVIVESAKMFGPGGIRQAFAEQREYLMATYWEPAADADKPGIIQWINEIQAEQQLAYDTVAGTLRTVDPQRVDNRIGRLLQSLSTFGVMGKVAFASVPEILRPGMVNGYGTQFNVILQKYIGDLESLRGNTELNELTGELFDLASKQMHIQAVTIQDGEPTLGGTWLENLINDQVPNLYKISGLTSLTTWQKTISGLAAQHSVMSQAIAVGEALRAGGIPDPKMVLKLNAMGINVRDAMLLSEMPIERYQGGSLILPAVDGWGSKANGRRAREILLNGIHAEMRRTIVTPSVGDRSTIFNGVWTHKGKKVFESDIMTIPMQFLSYGMGAHNAMLISGLQGRDHTLVLGMFYALLMGMFAEWFRTDSKVWMNKGYDEMIADGFDASGIGGFWFSGLNTQIERASSGKFGLRPLAGIKTDFDKKRVDQGVASAFGVAPGYFYDISRAFWDSSVTATERAQLIRKAIPYNNVVWWERIFREMANGAGGAFEGTKK